MGGEEIFRRHPGQGPGDLLLGEVLEKVLPEDEQDRGAGELAEAREAAA